MEGPIIKSSYTSPSTNSDSPYHPFIKKEKTDTGEQSDKVLQFTLALQRHRVADVINVGTNNGEEDQPLVVNRTPRSVECVDLTLSDEEDEASFATQPMPPPRIQGFDQNGMSDTHRPSSNESTGPSPREEPSSTVDIQNGVSTLRHVSAVPFASEDDDEIDYETAMSSLEVQLDETDSTNHFNDLGETMEGDEAMPRRSLPYTEEEKRIALEGNKNYDYRTRLDEFGEEKYAIFKCPKCPTGFPRMHHYLVHLRSHDRKVGNFKCQDCDLVLANSAFLVNHMERHRLQREPEIFDMTLGRIPRTIPEKRPFPVSSTRGSPAKKQNTGMQHSLETPIPPIRRARSASPRESTSSQLVGTLSDFEGGNVSADSGNEDDRVEARKGNPNIVYRKGRRSHPNGRTYERTSYKCRDCPYSNEKYSVYLNHVQGHKQQRAYPCDHCTFSAKSQKYLERHFLVHSYQPEEEELQSAPTEEMDTTGNGEDGNTPVRGSGKKRKRRSGGSGRKSSGAVQCPKCPSRLSGLLNLRIHLKQHGKTGMKLSCPYCDYGSNRDDYMRNHMDAHVTSTTNVSASPSPTFGDGSSTTTQDTSGTQPDESLTAEEYEKVTTGNPRFNYMTVSTNGQPLPLETSFKCWHCPYATVKYSFLVTHQQRHEVSSKYSCNQCSYSASSIQALKNHRLAHTIQHQMVNKTSNAQSISFNGETPTTASPSSISGAAGLESRSEAGQFFISNIRIVNIMAMNEEPTVADVSTHGILKLKGNSEEGKSSYILAVMLGLGYDLCLDHRDETTSICGLNLKDAISHGKDFASIELTVSLRAFPQLQKDFGSQIKFSRRMTRKPSELSNVIVITSADPRPQFKGAHPKVLNGKDLISFLPKLKLSPDRLRLMLLDGENVKYLMDNSYVWYTLFQAAVEESDVDATQKTTETQFLLQRLEGKEKLQRERLEWFQFRLGLRPPVDSEKIRQVSEEDWSNHRKCTTEMNQLANERKELEQKLKNYGDQSRDGMAGYIHKMRTVFDKYLDHLNYHGEIIVCEKTHQLAICIWKGDAKEVRPTTIEGVRAMWKTLSNGKRRIAVIGLYLALWEISCYLGILAADAFSCTETDFHVPPATLPVLWELLNRKCVEQKQCIVSLPPEY